MALQRQTSRTNTESKSMLTLHTLLACVAFIATCALAQQPNSTNPFANMAIVDEEESLCQGSTPARIVIDRVVAYPQEGDTTSVTLRNVGGQTADLKGFRLTDSDTRPVENAMNLKFGEPDVCNNKGNTTIEPSETLLIKPQSENEPCGFPFTISFRDEINLLNPEGTVIASAKWADADLGSSLRNLPEPRLTSNGAEAYPEEPQYVKLPENKPVIETLRELGIYTTFLEALRKAGLEQALNGAPDPNYPGPPPKPTGPEQQIVPEFPWWFGFSIDRTQLPPPPPPPGLPPPPAPGIPEMGPYTIMAPTDEAFDTLLLQLGGGRPLPKATLMELPELKDILQYHVLPGMYATGNMYNNTPIWTTKSVSVTPFTDPCQTEGRVMLHDGCVDKPTPDTFSCEEQVEFNKCYFPFMTSALAAQWQGGFCQRTCQRCSCAAGTGITCSQIVQPDVRASNGIVQGVSRVMFPPPAFNKSMYIGMPGIDPKLQEALTSDKPIDIEQGDAAVPTTTTIPIDPAATGVLSEGDAAQQENEPAIVPEPAAAEQTGGEAISDEMMDDSAAEEVTADMPEETEVKASSGP